MKVQYDDRRVSDKVIDSLSISDQLQSCATAIHCSSNLHCCPHPLNFRRACSASICVIFLPSMTLSVLFHAFQGYKMTAAVILSIPDNWFAGH